MKNVRKKTNKKEMNLALYIYLKPTNSILFNMYKLLLPHLHTNIRNVRCHILQIVFSFFAPVI